jgi:anti-sigma B factor antagonist
LHGDSNVHEAPRLRRTLIGVSVGGQEVLTTLMPRSTLALIAADDATGPPVVSVRGELDVGTAPSLREWLGAATEQGTRSAVIDLRGVSFVAGAALHVLCDEQERLLEHDERLTIVCDQPELLNLFQVVELQGVLDIVTSRAEARERRDGDVRPSQHLADWVARHPPDDGVA